MRILLVVLLTCAAVQAEEIVNVPLGMQWVRTYNDYSYNWHATNDYAGQIPLEPTQATLLVSMLRLDSPVQTDPWQTTQYQPQVQLNVWLERSDATARYDFTAPLGHPFAGTTTLVPNLAESVTPDGTVIPLSDVELVPLEADQISTFLQPEASFVLHVEPKTMNIVIRDVWLNVSGSLPGQSMAFGTTATPLDGWQVISADDPPSDPPTTTPEPPTIMLMALPLLLALMWKSRSHQPQVGQ